MANQKMRGISRILALLLVVGLLLGEISGMSAYAVSDADDGASSAVAADGEQGEEPNSDEDAPAKAEDSTVPATDDNENDNEEDKTPADVVPEENSDQPAEDQDKPAEGTPEETPAEEPVEIPAAVSPLQTPFFAPALPNPVADLQAQIDALPTVEEFLALSAEEQSAAAESADELYAAYLALSAEEQSVIDPQRALDLLDAASPVSLLSADTNPYTLSVTFDSQDLRNTAEDPTGEAVYKEWLFTDAENLEIVVDKDNTIPDDGKQYVLVIKLPQQLYFTGLPQADDYIAAQSFTKNPDIDVQMTGNSATVFNVQPYSGELRLLLDKTKDHFNIVLPVKYDQYLWCAVENALLTADGVLPIEVSLVQQDDTDISSVDTTNPVLHYVLDKAYSSSTAYNLAGDNTTKLNSGKGRIASASNIYDYTTGVYTNGGITIAPDSEGYLVKFYSAARQDLVRSNGYLYQHIKVTFDVPKITYIDADGVMHTNEYLLPNITETVTQTRAMKYTITPHTETIDGKEVITSFTYEADNVMLVDWKGFLLTPGFSLPAGTKLQEGTSVTAPKIKLNITATNMAGQVCQIGAATPLTAGYTATFKNAESTVKLLNRTEVGYNAYVAYNEATETWKSPAKEMLGGFVLQNTGSGYSDPATIEIVFNSDSETDEGKYLVDRVHCPVDSTHSTEYVTFHIVAENAAGETKSYDWKTKNGTGKYKAITVSNAAAGKALPAGYYIKSVTYTLDHGIPPTTRYYDEVFLGGRTRTNAAQAFWGYYVGEAGSTASATFSVKNWDGTDMVDPVTVQTTATSANDTMYYADSMTVDGATSSYITAGQTSVVELKIHVPNENYANGRKKVTNGYNVLEGGVVGLVLPEGIAVSNVTAKNNQDVAVESIDYKSLTDGNVLWTITLDRNARTGYFSASGLNALPGGNTLTIKIPLSTQITMDATTIDLGQNIYFAGYHQGLTQSEKGRAVPDTYGLTGIEDDDTIRVYGLTTHQSLTIATNTASLTVTDGINEVGKHELSLSNEDGGDLNFNYQVNIKNGAGGTTSNFSYYIPVPKTSSAKDPTYTILQNGFDAALTGAVETTYTPKDGNDVQEVQVFYTTDSIKYNDARNVSYTGWKTAAEIGDNWDKVTLIKVTVPGEILDDDSLFINVPLTYGGDKFANQAGKTIEWRSTGYYMYTIENIYFSGDYTGKTTNTVTLKYVHDYSDEIDLVRELDLTADASSDENPTITFGAAGSEIELPAFEEPQTFKISTGAATLTAYDFDTVADLTGSDANSNFGLKVKLNEGTAVDLSTLTEAVELGETTANTAPSVTVDLNFSRQLNDPTQKYITFVLESAAAKLTFKVNVVPVPAKADATNSGVLAGEVFVSAAVNDSVTIAKDSSFTAVYVVNTFQPSSYESQTLALQTASGAAAKLPSGATVILMELNESGEPQNYWYYLADGSATSIDLKSFKKMGGSGSYSYDTTSSTLGDLRYKLVLNFSGASDLLSGDYQLVFNAQRKAGTGGANVTVPLDVTFSGLANFGLTNGETDGLTTELTYSFTAAGAEDARWPGKQLAIVLQAAEDSDLPADLSLTIGDATYNLTADQQFIIPISAVVPTGNTSETLSGITLVSKQFPASGADYTFTPALYVTADRTAPLNGEKVATAEDITFTAEEVKVPSLEVTGVRSATTAEWVNGQDINIDYANLAEGSTITIALYDGNVQQTTVLASAAGESANN
ncbi:MAG: hypothetical protein IJ049_00885, partial [Oscillospiraceae bacterium]|nr:hypothetical protein [Oscillospiraceae bacterium]